jgi:hypothetical protein
MDQTSIEGNDQPAVRSTQFYGLSDNRLEYVTQIKRRPTNDSEDLTDCREIAVAFGLFLVCLVELFAQRIQFAAVIRVRRTRCLVSVRISRGGHISNLLPGGWKSKRVRMARRTFSLNSGKPLHSVPEHRTPQICRKAGYRFQVIDPRSTPMSASVW